MKRQLVYPWESIGRFDDFPNSIFRLLHVMDNDYCNVVKPFAPKEIPFIDVFAPYSDVVDLLTPRHRIKPPSDYIKSRKSFVHKFLGNTASSMTLSIIIPLAGDHSRWTELKECLASIERQTFVAKCPKNVDVLVVQDGCPSGEPAGELVSGELPLVLGRMKSRCRLFLLRERQGRATPRSVGLHFARGDISFFIDSSMVLEKSFLTEHMIRHAQVRNIALTGFKEAIDFEEYHIDPHIRDRRRLPDRRKDWKWHKVLDEYEEEFDYNGRSFRCGGLVKFMRMTDFLRLREGIPFAGDGRIGQRGLPQFFQTGLCSLSTDIARGVGGFDRDFDPIWGFEDSFFGALIFASGTKLVPLPSSIAFKIEDRQDENSDAFKDDKQGDIKVSRSLYDSKLYSEITDHNKRKLTDCIRDLRARNILQEITIRRKANKDSLS